MRRKISQKSTRRAQSGKKNPRHRPEGNAGPGPAAPRPGGVGGASGGGRRKPAQKTRARGGVRGAGGGAGKGAGGAGEGGMAAIEPRRVCVGVITGAQGVRGAVRVKSFTAVPEDVAAYGAVEDEAGA